MRNARMAILVMVTVGLFIGYNSGTALGGLTIEVTFEGIVTWHSLDHWETPLVEEGDPFSGSFTYDADAINLNPLSGAGQYELLSMSRILEPVTTDEYGNTEVLDSGYENLNGVINVDPALVSIHYSEGDGSLSAGSYIEFYLDFDLAFPLVPDVAPPHLFWVDNAAYVGNPESRFTLRDPSGHGWVVGDVQSLSSSVIPEPTTLLLLGLGGVMLRRKR